MFLETTIRAARYAKTEARVLLRNNVQAICLAIVPLHLCTLCISVGINMYIPLCGCHLQKVSVSR